VALGDGVAAAHTRQRLSATEPAVSPRRRCHARHAGDAGRCERWPIRVAGLPGCCRA